MYKSKAYVLPFFLLLFNICFFTITFYLLQYQLKLKTVVNIEQDYQHRIEMVLQKGEDE